MTQPFYDFSLLNTTSARFVATQRHCICTMCSIARTAETMFGPTLSRSAVDAMKEYTEARRMLFTPTYRDFARTRWNTCKGV